MSATREITVSISEIKVGGAKNPSICVVKISSEDISNNIDHLCQIKEDAAKFPNYISNAYKIRNFKERLVRGLGRDKYAKPFSVTISDSNYFLAIIDSENRGIKEAPKPSTSQLDGCFLYFLAKSNVIYEYNEFIEYRNTFNEFETTHDIKNEISVSKLFRSRFTDEKNPFTPLFPFNRNNPIVIRAPGNANRRGIRKGNSIYGKLEIFSYNEKGEVKVHCKKHLTIALSSALNENRKNRRPKIENSFSQLNFNFTISNDDFISNNTFYIRYVENDACYASIFKGTKKQSPPHIQTIENIFFEHFTIRDLVINNNNKNKNNNKNIQKKRKLTGQRVDQKQRKKIKLETNDQIKSLSPPSSSPSSSISSSSSSSPLSSSEMSIGETHPQTSLQNNIPNENKTLFQTTPNISGDILYHNSVNNNNTTNVNNNNVNINNNPVNNNNNNVVPVNNLTNDHSIPIGSFIYQQPFDLLNINNQEYFVNNNNFIDNDNYSFSILNNEFNYTNIQQSFDNLTLFICREMNININNNNDFHFNDNNFHYNHNNNNNNNYNNFNNIFDLPETQNIINNNLNDIYKGEWEEGPSSPVPSADTRSYIPKTKSSFIDEDNLF